MDEPLGPMRFILKQPKWGKQNFSNWTFLDGKLDNGRKRLWRWSGGNTGRRFGGFCFPHAGQIPAANAAALRGAVATARRVTIATTAALATRARGGVPFAEGPPAFVAANQQIGGGAALQTGKG